MKSNVYCEVLKLEKDGDWEEAHRIIQDINTPEAAWIHAYLHRVEGDHWNANYWYNRAGREFFSGATDEEWEMLFRYFSERYISD